MSKFPAARIVVFVLVTFTCVFLSPVDAGEPDQLAETDWPMYQRDPQHSGRSDYWGIQNTPEVLWRRQLPTASGENATGMSIGVDGTIYASANGYLNALDPRTGEIQWTIALGNAYRSRSTPAVARDGSLYWGSSDSFARLRSDGTGIWQHIGLSSNLIVGSSPVLASDGTIYFTHDALFSLAPDGAVNWVHPFTWYTHSSPAIGPDGTIYTGSGDGKLYAFSSDGTVKWHHSILTYDRSPSVGPDGTVYIGTYHSYLYAFDPDGTYKWQFVTDESAFYDSTVSASPAIGPDGTVYFGTHVSGGASSTAHIYAVNPDGTLKWKYPISVQSGNPGIVAPLVVDTEGRVYACTDSGSCLGLAPDGSLLWEYIPYTDGRYPWYRTAPLIISNGITLILDPRCVVRCLVEPTLPRLRASPDSISVVTPPGTDTVTRTISITGSFDPITWTASITPTVNWVTATITNGVTPSELVLEILPGELRREVSASIYLDTEVEDVLVMQPVIPLSLIVDYRIYLPTIRRN
ncbi:MAG: outer membrane protein assembly factor BamB family protein [Planctomycetota bacterium]|jgi:outer membrane protein assembly factor BamB